MLVPASGAVLLAAADTYVVVVVLPSIMGSTGVGLDQLQRATPIITGFLLGYVALLPLIGRLADRHGRRSVFLACLVTFGIGSVVTASAHSLSVVIAGRAIQGAGGGGLVPVTLSLVASLWGPEDRGLPLGVVSAVQELGSVIGPLYGAGVVALSGWRTIFWLNLPLALLAGVAFALGRAGRPSGSAESRNPDVVGGILVSLGGLAVLLALWSPAALTGNVHVGQLYTAAVSGPTWSALTSPMAFLALGLIAAFVAWEAAAPATISRVVAVRRLPGAFRGVDVSGALLLAGVLACVIVAFSTSDPNHQFIASSWPLLLPLGVVLLGALLVHERRHTDPIIARQVLSARPAWGALVVSLAVGGALMAALVDVPLYARATTDPTSQVAAALVLVRFLVAVPVGALAGGWLCRRYGDASVATAGMALAALAFLPMTSWGSAALGAPWHVAGTSLGFGSSDAELVLCGLGFGAVIAPINDAVLRAVPAPWHGLATALAVVARMVGMLVGLSALTAFGLRTFYADQRRLGSPVTLCPANPANCAAYDRGSKAALLGELHTVFAGAAICAGLAALAAALTLSRVRPSATPLRSAPMHKSGTRRFSDT